MIKHNNSFNSAGKGFHCVVLRVSGFLNTFPVFTNLLWKMQPKVHLFLHLIEQVNEFGMNPSFWHTYGDEDLVGQLVDIGGTLHANTISLALLVKWVHCVFDDVLVDP